MAGFDTNKSGQASLIYSTYLGAATVAHALAVDALGAIHVGGEYCGNNKPSDFPLVNGFQFSPSTAGAAGAAIYAKLNPYVSGLTQLDYSTNSSAFIDLRSHRA